MRPLRLPLVGFTAGITASIGLCTAVVMLVRRNDRRREEQALQRLHAYEQDVRDAFAIARSTDPVLTPDIPPSSEWLWPRDPWYRR